MEIYEIKADNICTCLRGHRFPLHNEEALKIEMFAALKQMFSCIKEHTLDKKSRIDFMVEGVGIEVKIKGSSLGILKQCERYCEFEEVKALILVTNRSMGFPKTLNGKPCYVFALGRSWL